MRRMIGFYGSLPPRHAMAGEFGGGRTMQSRLLCLAALLLVAPATQAEELPIFDAHIHYSHDAWEMLPAAEAVAVLRRAGVKRALVSSSSDEGTQRLLAAAPDLIVPELRPYRSRGEIGSWVRDETVIPYLEERLARHRYVAIGEFHAYGADVELPVMRRVIELALQHGLFLHAHSDADAISRIFAQAPASRVLWAHSGFAPPAKVREMLERHSGLWADLAFRTDHAPGGRLDPDWRALFLDFPDRFMVGTDTFTPERWYYVEEHARSARAWLAELPREVAEKIAWRNGERLFTAANDACPDIAGAKRLATDGQVLKFRTLPASPGVGQPFAVELALCGADGRPAATPPRVDAWMPDHRHGMNLKPQLRTLAPGRFMAEGFLFHMPGLWEFRFEIGAPPDRVTLTSPRMLD
ncbi:MAG: hypothetical protein KIT81_07705 [Alphaproteobacteria bacterium]|nr:hypothetical protein [Alphaproteobacteria bacterium]